MTVWITALIVLLAFVAMMAWEEGRKLQTFQRDTRGRGERDTRVIRERDTGRSRREVRRAGEHRSA